MQHLALNDHVLSVVKGNPLEEHSYDSSAGWSDFDAIHSPRQDPTANPLDNWTLNLVAFTGNGESEAKALRTMMKSHEIITITDGKGQKWGRFTLRNIKLAIHALLKKAKPKLSK